MTPSNPASIETMAKAPKSSAKPEATEPLIVGQAKPVMPAAAAHALAKAQAKLGYAAPPIVTRSIEADQQGAAEPVEPSQTPPGLAGDEQ